MDLCQCLFLKDRTRFNASEPLFSGTLIICGILNFKKHYGSQAFGNHWIQVLPFLYISSINLNLDISSLGVLFFLLLRGGLSFRMQTVVFLTPFPIHGALPHPYSCSINWACLTRLNSIASGNECRLEDERRIFLVFKFLVFRPQGTQLKIRQRS